MKQELKKINYVRHYHELVVDICNLKGGEEEGSGEKLENIPLNEIEGYYGVAMVLAFIKGVEPDLVDLCEHLQISTPALEIPFSRLKINGFFSKKYSARNDIVLKGQVHKFGNSLISRDHFSRVSWCLVAGIAGGIMGLQ